MSNQEPNKVLILIDKCPDCPKTECPHRQVAGLIPNACPQIDENNLLVFTLKFFSEIDVAIDMLKKPKVVAVNFDPNVISKEHDRNDALGYYTGTRAIRREARPEDAMDYVFVLDEDVPPWHGKVLEKIKKKLGLITMEKGESDERKD